MKTRKIISVSAALMLALASVPTTAFAAAESKQMTVRVIVENTTFSKEEGAEWDGLLIDSTVAIDESSTAFTAFEAALKASEKSLSASGDWVIDISGVGDKTKSPEMFAGWTFTVNDWFATDTMGSFKAADKTLADGDVIDVQYTETWSDLGGDFSNNNTALKALDFSAGTLAPEFDPDVKEYTLSLGNATEVITGAAAANKNFQVRAYKNEYAPGSDSHFRPTDSIQVYDGDKIIIGVGNSEWPSMNNGQTETVYTINIKSDITADAVAAAAEVEKMIEEMGEASLENEDKIRAAEAAYLRLSDTAKGLVTNRDKLNDTLEELDDLKAAQLEKTFDDVFKATADTVAKAQPAVGSEWKMIGLARAGSLGDARDRFIASLKQYTAEADGNKLNARRSTENSKESVAAAALGCDPSAFAGKDLTAPLSDKDYISAQGITGLIWSNIALTGLGKTPAATDDLLAAQLENGAFSFDGKTADVDITAMCITALAKVPEAKAAINKAVEWLASRIGENGSFGSCESDAQVIIALTSVNSDPGSAIPMDVSGFLSSFIKNYYLGNGEFAHTIGGGANDMATEQAFLALVSIRRLINGETALYDFSDMQLVPVDAEKNSDPLPDTGAAAGGLVAVILAGVCIYLSGKKHS